MQLSSVTSTKTGVAPTSATTPAVAGKVKPGTKTASPGPIPSAISAIWRASVPLAQVTAWATPARAASAVSSSATAGPRTKRPSSSTRAMAASISALRRRYCASRSMKAMGSRLAS